MTSSLQNLLNLPRYASDGARAIKPGFERIESVLEHLGRPDKAMDIALVAGTNGKGSTASMMAACLTSAGYRTALQTSPHLLRVNERMRVDGVAAPDKWLEQAIEAHLSVFQEIGTSFYEATLALSLHWFATQRVSHAVIETGLGGRLDATNFLNASVSVITTVDLDHTELLGNTIEEIASEKAGIIKSGKPVVLGNMYSAAAEVISRLAQDRSAPVHDYKPLPSVEPPFRLALAGRHQVDNASTALNALAAWGLELNEQQIRGGLKHTPRLSGIRARSEIAREQPLLMIDVAHNAAALTASVETFMDRCADKGALKVVIGLLADKDIDSIATLLSKYPLEVHTVDTDGGRGLSSSILASRFEAAGLKNVHPAYDLRHALRETVPCLITGSHMVAATAILAID